MHPIFRAFGLIPLVAANVVAQDLFPKQTVVGRLNTGDAHVTAKSASRDGRFIAFDVTRRGEISWIPDTARVWVFDRRSNQSFQLVANASALTWSPQGDMVAFLRKEETGARPFVWVMPLNAATGKPAGLARRIGRSPTYWGIRPSISPDGRSVAYPTSGPWYLPRISRESSSFYGVVVAPVAGGAERVVVPDGPHPHSEVVDWSPDGKSLYFVEVTASEGILFRVSSEGGNPEQIATAVGSFIGVSGDGKYLCYSIARGSNTVIATLDGKIVGHVKPPSQFAFIPSELIWAATGARLLVANTVIPTELQLVSVATGKAERIAGSEGANINTWLPDGSRLTIRTNDGRAMAVDPVTRLMVPTPPTRRPIATTIVSPDSTRVLLRRPQIDTNPGRLLIASRTNPGDSTALPTLRPWIGNVRWSPDSKQILYVGGEQLLATKELRLLTLASGRDEKVTVLPDSTRIPVINDVSLAWRPDGSAIHYLLPHDGKMWLRQIQLRPVIVERDYPLWNSENRGFMSPLSDTSRLIVGDNGVSILSLQSGDVRLVIPNKPNSKVNWIGATPDKKHIVAIDYDIVMQRPATRHSLTVFDLNGRIVRSMPLAVDYDDIRGVVWLPNGQDFVSAAEYPTPRNNNPLRPKNGTDENGRDLVLLSTTGAPPRVITGQVKFHSLTAWRLSPDGKYLAINIVPPLTMPTQIFELDLGVGLSGGRSGGPR